MDSIRERVKAIVIDKLGVDEDEVTLDANFTNDLGADSLDMVELIMEAEKEFGIGIPDDAYDPATFTFGDLLKLVEETV